MLITNSINANSFCSFKLIYNFENIFSYACSDRGKFQITHDIKKGKIPHNLYTVSASKEANVIPPRKEPETVPNALAIQLFDCITPSFSLLSVFFTSSTVIESVATSAKQIRKDINIKEPINK